MALRILYFARLREQIGRSDEEIGGAGAPASVGALIDELRARGGGYAVALADEKGVRIAVDQQMADRATPLSGDEEVAIFPPVTGG